MSAIVKALQKEAKGFYKKHPVKGALKKIKETCKSIWGNIDKLSLVKNAAKLGTSLATGTAPLALLNIGAEHVTKILTDVIQISTGMRGIGRASREIKNAPEDGIQLDGRKAGQLFWGAGLYEPGI